MLNGSNVITFDSNCIVGGLLYLVGLVSKPEPSLEDLLKRIDIQNLIYRNFNTYNGECSSKEDLFQNVFKGEALENLFDESQLARAVEICSNTRGDLLIKILSKCVSYGKLVHA